MPRERIRFCRSDYLLPCKIIRSKMKNLNITERRLLIFCAMVFGVGWIAILTAFFLGHRYGDDVFNVIGLGLSILPAMAMLAARKLTGEDFELESVGLSLHLKGNVKHYIFAYFLPLLLVFVAGLLFFVTHPAQYDPLASELVNELAGGDISENDARAAVYRQAAMGVVAGPLINIITAIAEALGFQGYLLPKLRELFGESRLSGVKSALLCGLFWGIWNIPLLAQGSFYGEGYKGAPFLGILTGIAYYVLLSVPMSCFTFKTGSIIPSALIFGGCTAAAATPLYFTSGAVSLIAGPVLFGVFGCCAILAFDLLFVLRMRRMELAGELFFMKS